MQRPSTFDQYADWLSLAGFAYLLRLIADLVRVDVIAGRQEVACVDRAKRLTVPLPARDQAIIDTAHKSEKDIDGHTMSVLQLTEKGSDLWSILGRSGIDQDSAAEALKAYLLKDPNFDQLSLAVESCKTSVGLRCLEMHIESINDQQMQGALWDAINRRKPYMLDTTAA